MAAWKTQLQLQRCRAFLRALRIHGLVQLQLQIKTHRDRRFQGLQGHGRVGRSCSCHRHLKERHLRQPLGHLDLSFFVLGLGLLALPQGPGLLLLLLLAAQAPRSLGT